MEQNLPALDPPPGVVPNFHDPPNGNLQGHFGIAICLFLVASSASLRAYSRIFCIKQVKVEDYVALAALGPFIAFTWGLYKLMSITGFYVHQWNIPLANLSPALYIIYLNTSLFQATMGLLKTAILLEWPRLFVPAGRRNGFYWTCRVTMAANIAYYTIGILASALACTPHEKVWKPSLPGQCLNKAEAFFITNASLNLVSDIIILALPHKVIWNLNMTKKKKIGVSLAFAVGIIACLIAVVRLATAVIYYTGGENLYNISAVLLWGMAELATAIAVFCLPAIPAVFKGNGKRKWPSAQSHHWTSARFNRVKFLSGSEQPVDNMTWKSSTFLESASVDGQDRKNPETVKQPYPAPKFKQYNSRNELSIANNKHVVSPSPAASFADDRCEVGHNKPFHDTHQSPTMSWYDAT